MKLLIFLLLFIHFDSISSCIDHLFLPFVQTLCFSSSIEDSQLKIQVTNMLQNQITYQGIDPTFLIIPDTPNIQQEFLVFQDPSSSEYSNLLVGIALDGIPIYHSTDEGSDFINQGLLENTIKIDRCGGTFSQTPDGLRYHYRVMPTCIINPSNSKLKRSQFIQDVHELLIDFESLSSPQLLGYSLQGVPIYSPIFSRILSYQNYTLIPLDNCNGLFYNGSYGYYATPSFPYLIGCHGPGLYEAHHLEQLPATLNTNTFAMGGSSFSSSISSHPQTQSRPSSPSFQTCPLGYYSVDAYTQNPSSGCHPCPAGRYTTRPTSTTLIRSRGINPPGDYRTYCDKEASPGFYSPAGSTGQIPCPAGRYGDFPGLKSADCSGACSAGFFCPQGSMKRAAFPCGNSSFYCPVGSSIRSRVDLGYFTVPFDSSSASSEDWKLFDSTKTDDRFQISQVPCPAGSFCIEGIRYPCPPGRYGQSESLFSSTCTDVCPIGHYCPLNSVLPTRCPPGTFGSQPGLTSSECSGLCDAGHWCGFASTSPQENICPSSRYGAQRGLKTIACSATCEQAASSSTQTLVDISMRRESIADGESRFFDPSGQHDLSPYDSTLQLTMSNDWSIYKGGMKIPSSTPYCVAGSCAAGYYCPAGSTSPKQVSCGDESYYCPAGSSEPRRVLTGFYTVGPISVPQANQSESDASTRWGQVLCEPGHYCVRGTRYACPAGSYGDESGLSDSSCSGLCEAGFRCKAGSTSPRQFNCANDQSIYCPPGTAFESPIPVPSGDFSISSISDLTHGSVTTRSDRLPCDPGSYCIEGVPRLCPAGTYSLLGSSSSLCDGLCDAGFYCLKGSTSPRQFPCPAGRFGLQGEVSSSCAGECLAGYYCPSQSASPTQFPCGGDHLYCPPGSSSPLPVDLFHFTSGGTVNTRVAQRLCAGALGGSVNGSHGTGPYLTPPSGPHRENVCPSTTRLV